MEGGDPFQIQSACRVLRNTGRRKQDEQDAVGKQQGRDELAARGSQCAGEARVERRNFFG